ncbi:hypothetical protein J6590_004855 [Homalodisca vitripennis]|nr:hypothetical protein J6590_004855 [Homalodisca vitripennis]
MEIPDRIVERRRIESSEGKGSEFRVQLRPAKLVLKGSRLDRLNLENKERWCQLTSPNGGKSPAVRRSTFVAISSGLMPKLHDDCYLVGLEPTS